jgi:hypothetical protein
LRSRGNEPRSGGLPDALVVSWGDPKPIVKEKANEL